MYSGFYHSVIGASHTAKGTVCQDFSDFKVYENYALAAVADGHGSKKHFRSDVGARMAVAATVQTVASYYADAPAFEESFERDPKRLIRKIEKQIISRWDRAILRHLQENPFTALERAPFSEEEFEDIRTESIYGTTLIAVVYGRKFTFGIQIGDGSMVVIDQDAQAEMPIIDDESCPANLTASMSNSNAIDLFNSFYTMEAPLAVFVSTDGLYTSFRSSEDFLDYHTIIASHLGQLGEFDKVITRNLVKRTNFGTQDDISMAGAFDPQFLAQHLQILRTQVEKNKRRAEMRKAEQAARIQKQKLKNQLRRNPNLQVE
ncbi:MAG: protein phosphatase 2C domain-containing protein [Oscillospiraceae bacterium]|nr:protein phosphatase 2C domain-containing protein [Oscillospiraceae bacterium]